MKSRSAKKEHSPKTSPVKFPPTLSTAKEWERLAKRLAKVIEDLEEDEYLIISEKKRNVYVQFAAQGFFGMRVEAAGNEFLGVDVQLPKDAQRTLRSLGWLSPTYVKTKVRSEPPDGSCNYYIDADTSVPFAVLARVAIQTLQQFYRTRHPGDLQYKAFGSSGYMIRFPSLGLKRNDK